MKKSILISLLTIACIFGIVVCTVASTGVATADDLRLRKGPSTDSEIIELISINDKVEILEKEDGWYKVKVKDKEGYVSANYIKVLEEKNEIAEQIKANEEEKNIEEKQNENTEISNVKNILKTIPAEVDVYLIPIINSAIINKTTESIDIEVISEVNGWSYVKIKSIKGWVRTESIQDKETEKQDNSTQKVGYITINGVNFREEANLSANIISKLQMNSKLIIFETVDGWSKVEYNGKTGYVYAEYISDKKIETSSRSSVNRKTAVNTVQNNNEQNVEVNATVSSTSNETVTETINQTVEENANEVKNEVVDENINQIADENENEVQEEVVTGEKIVEYAMQFVGYKYVYGGASPSGFDCSGFTQYVYKQFGYSLNRSAAAQKSNGVGVDKSAMQPGDIICFSNSRGSSSIGHVGMYIGGGKFVHAANSRRGVIVSNVDGDGFYYVCARRII